MAPKIPDRWIPYKACGDVIEGTRIICFKVPLHKNVQTIPQITQIWDIPAVLEEIPKLGAVIDLTNTARYYNPREFEAAGVLHRKILMPGREIPSEHKVQEFMDAVDEFLGKDCDSLVGVHCTHGLNRTGYMVCRYLRDRLKITAEDAIKRFEKARGYEIEREIYLAGLLDKKLPSPDFDELCYADGNDGHRRQENESQPQEENVSTRKKKKPRHRKKRKESQPRENNDRRREESNSQSRDQNERPDEHINSHLTRRNRYASLPHNNDNKPKTKSQKKFLQRKRKKERNGANARESRDSSQAHQPRSKNRKIH